MIDASSGTNRTVNIYFHSVGDSFHDLAPPPASCGEGWRILPLANRHKERCGLPSPRPDSNRRRFNHPYSWAALPTELQGHRVPHSRGSGFRHHPICCVKEVNNESEWCKRPIPYILYHNIWINQYIYIQYSVFFRMDGGTPPPCSLLVAGHTQQTLPKHQEHRHVYFSQPSYSRIGSLASGDTPYLSL